MLFEIKKKINELKGKNITLLVDVGRNKNETYHGYVLNTYDKVWTFQTQTEVKSFSYSDLLINNVVISS